jgi:hypothetical protein
MDPYMKERWDSFKNEMNKECLVIQQISTLLNNMKNDHSGIMSNSGVSLKCINAG